MGNITNQYIGSTVLRQVRNNGYLVVCYSKRSTKEIQDEHMAYMAQITENLGPIQCEELNQEQKDWLYFRLQRPFPKPYRQSKEIVIPLKWQEIDE
jgi:hypothetical protein